MADPNILVRELAEKISDRTGSKISQRKLYQRLRDDGYVIKDGTYPTKKAHGLLVLTERYITTAGGFVRPVETTKVTPDGVDYFLEIYGGDDIPF